MAILINCVTNYVSGLYISITEYGCSVRPPVYMSYSGTRWTALAFSESISSQCLFPSMHTYTHHCTSPIDPTFPHIPPKHFPSHHRITRRMFYLRRSDSKRKEFNSSPWWASSFDLLDNHCIWRPSAVKNGFLGKNAQAQHGEVSYFYPKPIPPWCLRKTSTFSRTGPSEPTSAITT